MLVLHPVLFYRITYHTVRSSFQFQLTHDSRNYLLYSPYFSIHKNRLSAGDIYWKTLPSKHSWARAATVRFHLPRTWTWNKIEYWYVNVAENVRCKRRGMGANIWAKKRKQIFKEKNGIEWMCTVNKVLCAFQFLVLTLPKAPMKNSCLWFYKTYLYNTAGSYYLQLKDTNKTTIVLNFLFYKSLLFIPLAP